jgi:hypothetical protein
MVEHVKRDPPRGRREMEGNGGKGVQRMGYLVVYSDIEHQIGLHFLDGELFKRCVPEVKKNPVNAE